MTPGDAIVRTVKPQQDDAHGYGDAPYEAVVERVRDNGFHGPGMTSV